MREYRDLRVCQLAYKLKTFLGDKRYLAMGHIRRSSYGAVANITEPICKRQHSKMIVSKMADSDDEATGKTSEVFFEPRRSERLLGTVE